MKLVKMRMVKPRPLMSRLQVVDRALDHANLASDVELDQQQQQQVNVVLMVVVVVVVMMVAKEEEEEEEEKEQRERSKDDR
jgi:hypothetical protein